jgi:hypothetical protein
MENISNGMKFSTIKRIIRAKLESIAESIKDDNLKSNFCKNAFVSGGCITSMLTGSKVNDFDVYFKSYEFAKEIAEYYVKTFNTLNMLLVKPGVTPYAPVVKEENRINCKGSSERRIIIYMKSAGIAGEEQTTYDYFESRPSEAAAAFIESAVAGVDPNETDPVKLTQQTVDLVNMKDQPKTNKTPFRPVCLTENAITLSDKVQLIIRFYGSPSEVHENFDFLHCMMYYDYSTNKIVASAEMLESVLTRNLIYNGSLYPVCSIFRIRKFISRGWRISAGQLLKMVYQVSKLDLSDKKILQDQLIGVDQAYMHQLISAINSKEGKVDENYLAQLVDQIFE